MIHWDSLELVHSETGWTTWTGQGKVSQVETHDTTTRGVSPDGSTHKLIETMQRLAYGPGLNSIV